jgi:hypothetical protein
MFLDEKKQTIFEYNIKLTGVWFFSEESYKNQFRQGSCFIHFSISAVYNPIKLQSQSMIKMAILGIRGFSLQYIGKTRGFDEIIK